ncbi:hypothetical protein PHYPSEUDO_015198 [Phytophthora pseudosyringae]|uniref:Uncharacterized protein n=1 Tax=Phytophthora pseudosyringae TaxID=221518 RepID=A0A8T1V6V1_9STRA|nr:hypothetical protein PHYPSEUDO_015198 [Phytophthora pseudosyringae]
MSGRVGVTTDPYVDEKVWVKLHDWADSTTKEWSKQAKAAVRRQQRCESMFRLRVLKKNEFLQLKTEREQLENQVKKCLAALNEHSMDPKTSSDDTLSRERYHALHRLALESDALRTDNVELIEEIHTRERFPSLVRDDALDMLPVAPKGNNSSSPNVYTSSKMSPWVPSACQHEDGWRVKFQSGEPSSYFHPFSTAEYDAVMKSCDDQFGASRPPLQPRGICSAGRCITHQLREDSSITRLPDALGSPLVFTGRSTKRTRVSIQVLQSFAIDSHVMVCNIPGPVHTRYFQLARRQLKLEPNGMRSLTFAIVLADSDGNARSLVAEEPQPDVKWIDEDGAYVKSPRWMRPRSLSTAIPGHAVKMNSMRGAILSGGPSLCAAGLKESWPRSSSKWRRE